MASVADRAPHSRRTSALHRSTAFLGPKGSAKETDVVDDPHSLQALAALRKVRHLGHDVSQSCGLDRQPRLLLELADHSFVGCFPEVESSTGKEPPAGARGQRRGFREKYALLRD